MVTDHHNAIGIRNNEVARHNDQPSAGDRITDFARTILVGAGWRHTTRPDAKIKLSKARYIAYRAINDHGGNTTLFSVAGHDVTHDGRAQFPT